MIEAGGRPHWAKVLEIIFLFVLRMFSYYGHFCCFGVVVINPVSACTGD